MVKTGNILADLLMLYRLFGFGFGFEVRRSSWNAALFILSFFCSLIFFAVLLSSLVLSQLIAFYAHNSIGTIQSMFEYIVYAVYFTIVFFFRFVYYCNTHSLQFHSYSWNRFLQLFSCGFFFFSSPAFSVFECVWICETLFIHLKTSWYSHFNGLKYSRH